MTYSNRLGWRSFGDTSPDSGLIGYFNFRRRSNEFSDRLLLFCQYGQTEHDGTGHVEKIASSDDVLLQSFVIAGLQYVNLS